MSSSIQACVAGVGRRLATAVVATTLAAAAQADISIIANDASAVLGGTVALRFDLGFGALTELSSAGVTLQYDAAVLSLTGSSGTYHGAPFDYAAALVGGGQYSFATPSPGQVTATFFALDAGGMPQLPLALSGAGSFTLVFQVVALPQPGPTTPVSFDFEGADASLDALPSVHVVSDVNVSAVPEPAAWTLLLAGLPWLARRCAVYRKLA
jgi:hypothetical protein